MEMDRALDALHDVVGRRIGEDESDQRRHAEHPVHDAAGAVFVGKMPAIGAEQAGRDRVGCGQHACGFDIELINADHVARQPERQRDEGAKSKEVVERESPDLQILQWLELEQGAARPHAFGAALALDRVFLGSEPEDHRHDGDGGGPHLRRDVPAIGDQHEGREELGHRRADIAGAENTEGGALLLRRVEARDIGNAHRKRAARHADAERRDQDLDVSVRPGKHEGGNRRRQHDHRVDATPAVLVGPDAEKNAGERTGQDRRADEQAKLGLIEAELLLNLHADNRKDRPHREADGEGDGGDPQRAALLRAADDRLAWHDCAPFLLTLKNPAPEKPRGGASSLRSIKIAWKYAATV